MTWYPLKDQDFFFCKELEIVHKWWWFSEIMWAYHLWAFHEVQILVPHPKKYRNFKEGENIRHLTWRTTREAWQSLHPRARSLSLHSMASFHFESHFFCVCDSPTNLFQFFPLWNKNKSLQNDRNQCQRAATF